MFSLIIYMENNLGSYLRKVRKGLNLTLRDVEVAIGISNAYLSQIENNKIIKPSPNMLHKLAELYKISYEKLMDLSGYPIINPQKKVSIKLNHSFDDLLENEKKEVMDFINYLKSKREK